MTRKKRFAIVDYEAASSMQLCSTCSTRRLDRDMGLPWHENHEEIELKHRAIGRKGKRRVYRLLLALSGGFELRASSQVEISTQARSRTSSRSLWSTLNPPNDTSGILGRASHREIIDHQACPQHMAHITGRHAWQRRPHPDLPKPDPKRGASGTP